MQKGGGAEELQLIPSNEGGSETVVLTGAAVKVLLTTMGVRLLAVGLNPTEGMT